MTDLERIYRERRFFQVQAVNPRGPTWLPSEIRFFLGESHLVKGGFTKEEAEKFAQRAIVRKGEMVRVKSIFN
jgi:hypothetical protein